MVFSWLPSALLLTPSVGVVAQSSQEPFFGGYAYVCVCVRARTRACAFVYSYWFQCWETAALQNLFSGA